MKSSELGLGCWQFGPSFGFWEDQDQGESVRLLHWALRASIRHFDTASSYGNGTSEQLLGHQIRRFSSTINRSDITIATKIMPKTPALVGKDLQKSLARLCTSYIDILYLHWPSKKADLLGILDTMAELTTTGVIRSLGLSNFPLSLLPSFKDYPISYVQTPCSLLWTKDKDELLSYCTQQSIALVGYSPLGLGLLSGKYPTAPSDSRKNLFVFSKRSFPAYQDLYAILEKIAENHQRPMAQIALAWALKQGFDVLLLGARTKAQLQENVASLSCELTKNEHDMLQEASLLLAATLDDDQDNLFGHRW